MGKKYLSILLLITMVISVSCRKDTDSPSNSSKPSADSNAPYQIETSIDKLAVVKNSWQDDPKHVKQAYVDLEKEEKLTANIGSDGTLAGLGFVSDKIVSGFFPKAQNGSLEVGTFDPYNNTTVQNGSISATASYGKSSFVLQEKYYVTINSSENSGGFDGIVSTLNVETGELKTAYEFKACNVVNYITPVGDNSFAYAYYEAETEDWIVRYGDLNGTASKEIFRHTNDNKNKSSSIVGLSSDGEKVVLAVQYIEDEVYHTNLIWITKDGKWDKTEEPEFSSSSIGNKYEILGFEITNGYYLFSFDLVADREIYYNIYRRENDILYNLLENSPFAPNEILSDTLKTDSKIIFKEFFAGAEQPSVIVYDFKANTVETYEFPVIENQPITHICVDKKGDLFVFFGRGEINDIKYSIAKNFRSIETPVFNGGLYKSLEEQQEELK